MKTNFDICASSSAEATSPDRILQIALTALNEGNFVEFVDHFSDGFTFTDHALELEFKDKGRLIEFLAEIREYFPDSETTANTIYRSGERHITEWTFKATHTEPFLGRSMRKVPICVAGVSVVQIRNGKIIQWSDYYDQLQSRRYSVAACFTEWIEA